jgi:hypothetical protein
MTFSEVAKNRYSNGQLKSTFLHIVEILSCGLIASAVGWVFFMHSTIKEIQTTSLERTKLREAQISELQKRDVEFLISMNAIKNEINIRMDAVQNGLDYLVHKRIEEAKPYPRFRSDQRKEK